jgi:hypothetical protein
MIPHVLENALHNTTERFILSRESGEVTVLVHYLQQTK